MYPPLMRSGSSGIGYDEKADHRQFRHHRIPPKNELRHGEAMQIWDAVIAGGDVAIMPYSVFVEFVAAVRRRTGSGSWRKR